MNHLHYPKLRWPLEMRLEQMEEQQVLVLSCPLGIAEKPLGLIAGVAPLLHRFNGSNSLDALAAQFSSSGVTSDHLLELASLLDSHHFLDSPTYRRRAEEVRSQFAAAPSRPAFLAGLSYSDRPEQLESDLKEMIAAGGEMTFPLAGSMVGLVVPHIDYRRGAITYGKSYESLKYEKHDTYIVIGTAHQYSPHLFHLLAKECETPLGVLKNDKDFSSALAELYGEERAYADQFLHKREHSLELQLPFLRLIHPEASIVPILVGGFHNWLEKEEYPEEHEVYDSFVSACVSLLETREKESVCIVAGVDMAHVGAQFGDEFELSDRRMADIAERDELYLEAITKQDKHALFDHIAEDLDARRMCGFPTLYTVIDIFDRLGMRYHAQPFEYRQAVDRERGCGVTFAGVGLYQPNGIE